MTLTRFLMSLVAAGLIIGGGFMFCTLAEKRLINEARQALRQAKAAGTLPPELQNVDLETMPLEDVGIPVGKSTMRMVTVADRLSQFAVFLVPLVIIACVGAAWLLGRIV